jgi:hypothetical protein
MRCTQASDFVLSKLLRFTGLHEDEIKALPEHPELIHKHRLSWLLGRGLAPADILAIQRFLRREGLGRARFRGGLGRKTVAKIFAAPEPAIAKIPEDGEGRRGEDGGVEVVGTGQLENEKEVEKERDQQQTIKAAVTADGDGSPALSVQDNKAVV